jgi:hypothetical protein
MATGLGVTTPYGEGVVKGVRETDGMILVEPTTWRLTNSKPPKFYLNPKDVKPVVDVGDKVSSIFGNGVVEKIRDDGIYVVTLFNWKLANNKSPTLYMNASSLSRLSEESGSGSGSGSGVSISKPISKPICKPVPTDVNLNLSENGNNVDMTSTVADSNGSNFIELSELKSKRLSNNLTGIDLSKKEMYVSNETFQQLFEMTKETFASLPKWKRDEKKKAVGLF